MPFVSDENFEILKAENDFLKATNEHLKKRIAELEARLNQYENAHTPSSLLMKLAESKTQHRRLSSGRERGHVGSGRKSPETIDQHVKLGRLRICPHCRGPVRMHGKRHRRMTRLVPGKAENLDYEIPMSYCPHCDKVVEPMVPQALPNARFDVMFAVWIACLKMLGVSLDKIRFLLRTDYGVWVSKATLVNTMNKLAGFLQEDYENLRLELNREKQVHADETGWFVKGENHWLWEFVSKKTAYFSIQKSRGRTVPQKILNQFRGTLNVDFWNAYNDLSCEKQRCWQHLKRELDHVLEFSFSKEFALFAQQLLRLYRFAKRERNHGNKTRVFAEKRLQVLLSKKYSDSNVLRLVKRLHRHQHEMFTFCSRRGLPDHNNHAEQNIRPSVIIRKISYGNQSQQGAQTYAELMSFFQTSQLQHQNYPEYLQKLIQNRLEN